MMSSCLEGSLISCYQTIDVGETLAYCGLDRKGLYLVADCQSGFCFSNSAIYQDTGCPGSIFYFLTAYIFVTLRGM